MVADTDGADTQDLTVDDDDWSSQDEHEETRHEITPNHQSPQLQRHRRRRHRKPILSSTLIDENSDSTNRHQNHHRFDLLLHSNFSREYDDNAHVHQPLFGSLSDWMWSQPYFPTLAMLVVLVSFSMITVGQPQSYPVMWALIGLVSASSLFIASLIDRRLMICLMLSFEFWFISVRWQS
jgi:hypothetical protein